MSPGPDRVAVGHVLDQADDADHVGLGLARGERMHEADDAGRAAHVAFHVLHAGGGLDRDAARIETDALADDGDRLCPLRSRRRSSASRRGGCRAPIRGPPPSSAFMPSLPIAFSSSDSTSTPSFSSALARSANSAGKRTFGGSLTRLRANLDAFGDGEALLRGRARGGRMARADDEIGRFGAVVVRLLLARLVFVEPIAAQPKAEREIRGRRAVPRSRRRPRRRPRPASRRSLCRRRTRRA